MPQTLEALQDVLHHETHDARAAGLTTGRLYSWPMLCIMGVQFAALMAMIIFFSAQSPKPAAPGDGPQKTKVVDHH